MVKEIAAYERTLFSHITSKTPLHGKPAYKGEGRSESLIN